jgi:exopolysaccharide biosynthesis protein
MDNKPKKRRPPAVLFIALDVIAAALLLGIFYVTNYMIETEVEPVALPTPAHTATFTTPAASMPAATGSGVSATPTDTAAQATPAATADPNDWRAKFAGKFTDGKIEKTDNSYRSANVSIEIREVQKYDVTCYVADIYVTELKYFRTAFAKKPDKMGYRELTGKVAEENGAILAINGDHCTDNKGTVVRNGKMFREPKSSLDVFVMNYDGTMRAFSPDEFNVKKTKTDGAYQVWSFGPMLLRDGQPMTKFNSTLTGLNPRTAVGYYEPGHYCFVQVGGRQKGYSTGYTMERLSQLMYELGCTAAYNLDGGQSSEMIFLGRMLNRQDGGRRPTTDILYIGDN